MYFTNKGRINVFEIEIQFSDWLELSENRSARSNAGAACKGTKKVAHFWHVRDYQKYYRFIYF
jgi:hypothetical protein